jgi:hypothetical protein
MDNHHDLVPEALLERVLRETKTIVSHRGCADGFLSALLLADVLPDAKVVMLAHGRARDEFPATPGLLFCDMSPPEARRREFADVGAIVLDHHATARGLFVEGEDGAPALAGVYSDAPGVSGAVLACEVWQYARQADVPAWVLRRVREFARHVGIYDTWQDASPDWRWARCATATLHFYRRAFGEDLRTSEFAGIGRGLLKKDELGDLGTMLVQAEDREAAELAGRPNGRMKLYLIERTDEKSRTMCDVYSDAVVAAPDEDTARRIHPNNANGLVFITDKMSSGMLIDTWPRSVDRVKATLLSESSTFEEPKVVLASFHAG